MPLWWIDIQELADSIKRTVTSTAIDPTASVAPSAVLDDRSGAITIGPRTVISAGATILGPAVIGADCLIGNQAFMRGPNVIGDGVRIGYSTEIKNTCIADGVTIGPMCFVADSRVDEKAYLGAMVRTSNHRLDGRSISVLTGDGLQDTGLEKLGFWIGAETSLGIQVIILPGREVPPSSIFEPRITIDRNYRPGHYRVLQQIDCVSQRN